MSNHHQHRFAETCNRLGRTAATIWNRDIAPAAEKCAKCIRSLAKAHNHAIRTNPSYREFVCEVGMTVIEIGVNRPMAKQVMKTSFKAYIANAAARD